MSRAASHLVGHVTLRVPVRKVLLLPVALRLLLAAQPELVAPVLQVVLKLKTPWRDGTLYRVLSPLECTQRHIDGQLCGVKCCERYVG